MSHLLPILLFLTAAVVLGFGGCFGADKVASRPEGGKAQNASLAQASSFYQFTVNSLDGQPVSMERFAVRKSSCSTWRQNAATRHSMRTGRNSIANIKTA